MVKLDYRIGYVLGTGDAGDAVATLLRTFLYDPGTRLMSVERLHNLARRNGVNPSLYLHLNIGHQRMIISNRLRAIVRKGGSVVIGNAIVTPEGTITPMNSFMG